MEGWLLFCYRKEKQKRTSPGLKITRGNWSKPEAAHIRPSAKMPPMNLTAVEDFIGVFHDLDLIIIESGGDKLSTTFSPELADLAIIVIDVAAGNKIQR